MRIGVVGTFPPRPCGLATFTADLASALAGGHQVVVAALVDGRGDVVEGRATLRLWRHDAAASRRVAEELSAMVDVVVVQHEFGIYGGPDGALVSEFTTALRVPYAITLHTVLGTYTATQRAALRASLDGAAAVIVFSADAGELLAAQFPQVAGRCRVVSHGAPPELFRRRNVGTRRRVGVGDEAVVVTTFGLLSEGKGIEDAIRAVASLRHAVGGLVYIVAGRTHPRVVARDGERYRSGLVDLVVELDVADVVSFRDWFHDVEELADLLVASDVFVTPYTGAEQIVSGSLSFAVAAGLPFVSTPYRYARQLAAAGCGILADFAQPDQLAAALKEVLTDTTVAARLRAAAAAEGASMAWPHVAARTADILATIAADDR